MINLLEVLFCLFLLIGCRRQGRRRPNVAARRGDENAVLQAKVAPRSGLE